MKVASWKFNQRRGKKLLLKLCPYIFILIFANKIFMGKENRMAKLTQAMKDMVSTQQCFVGTVNTNGTPNVAPKRSTRVLSDESLIFTEGTGGATYSNIKRGSKVSVAVVNRKIVDGYRFIGDATLQNSGELYDTAVANAAKMGWPKPYGVVVINISEIQSLKPGPTAGKKIA